MSNEAKLQDISNFKKKSEDFFSKTESYLKEVYAFQAEWQREREELKQQISQENEKLIFSEQTSSSPVKNINKNLS